MAIPYKQYDEDSWSPTSDGKDLEKEMKVRISNPRPSPVEQVKDKLSQKAVAWKARAAAAAQSALIRAKGWVDLVRKPGALSEEAREIRRTVVLWVGILAIGGTAGYATTKQYASSEPARQSAYEENYKARLEEYENRIYMLKKLRDRYPQDSPQHVDLDKNIGELEQKMQVARRELAHFEMADTLPRDLARAGLEKQMNEIRAQLQTMEAE